MAHEVSEFPNFLVCPETRQRVTACSLADAEQRMAGGASLGVRAPERATPFGPTATVLLRDDNACAYPVVEGVPILLTPEMLFSTKAPRTFDLHDPKYDEAYEEMEYYNNYATQEAKQLEQTGAYDSLGLACVFDLHRQGKTKFLDVPLDWVDAPYDCASQWDAYQHLVPVKGKRVAQLGGKGTHAIKFLLAGAAEAWLVTPMLGEIRFAQAVARMVGVADRLRCAVGIGEELPFAAETLDVIYSGSCVHHMRTEIAFAEIARVLCPGGRFAAVDPWRAPLYALGTKVLGKREKGVYCRPLNPERVEPLRTAFREATVRQHGTLTRYPLLALQRFGLHSKLATAWRIIRFDDALCSLIPPLRRMGSSVAVMGTK